MKMRKIHKLIDQLTIVAEDVSAAVTIKYEQELQD